MELIHCETVLNDTQFMHSFIVCKNLWKELLIRLDMQQLHCLGCDWTENGECFYIKVPIFDQLN